MILSRDCEAIAAGLRKGDLVAYPCEGVWGLGCDPHSAQALWRLLQLKGRAASKGFILIAGQLEQLQPFVRADQSWRKAQQFWPGAVTCLVAAAAECGPLLTGESGNIAVRLSAHPPVAKLCEAFGGAITSTSANLSGEAPCRNAAEIEALWRGRVQWLYDADLGDLAAPTPIWDTHSGKWLRGAAP